MKAIIGTGITLILIAVLVIFAIRNIVINKRNGKSLSCGGDCSKCIGECGKNKM